MRVLHESEMDEVQGGFYWIPMPVPVFDWPIDDGVEGVLVW